MKTELSISVIIPVYNGGKSFQQCLSSLRAATPTHKEVIVVADGDTDDSWQVATTWGAKVIRVLNRGGPSRARNLGAASAEGDILFNSLEINLMTDYPAIVKMNLNREL